MNEPRQADLNAKAAWYSGPGSDAVEFPSLREALLHAMAIPVGERSPAAVLVTAGAERYGWNAIELLHGEAKAAGKL
jgi:hypothetical protein